MDCIAVAKTLPLILIKFIILGEISKFSELLDHEVCSRGVVNRHNNVLSENYNI